MPAGTEMKLRTIGNDATDQDRPRAVVLEPDLGAVEVLGREQEPFTPAFDDRSTGAASDLVGDDRADE